MKKYGYSASSGMASAPIPNKNMDLLLRNLIVETQWEQEQKKMEQVDATSDAVSDVQEDGTGRKSVDSPSALPPDPGMLVLQSQVDMPVSVEQVHSTYRPLPLDVNSAPEGNTKHMLDRKA